MSFTFADRVRTVLQDTCIPFSEGKSDSTEMARSVRYFRVLRSLELDVTGEGLLHDSVRWVSAASTKIDRCVIFFSFF